MTTSRFHIIFGLLCSIFSLLVKSQTIDPCNEYNLNCSLCFKTLPTTENCFYDLRDNVCKTKDIYNLGEYCNDKSIIASLAESEESGKLEPDINRKRRGFDDYCNEFNRECVECMQYLECFYDHRHNACKSRERASRDGWCNEASLNISTNTIFQIILLVISFLCFF
jgi:hypothetical protein